MGKRGPILTKINTDQFYKLCELHCTLKEIAGFFDCSEDTIERWCKRTLKTKFADISEQKRQKGKIQLRKAQYKAAIEGNIVMLIWLGKQHLGQSDKIEQKIDGSNAITINTIEQNL